MKKFALALILLLIPAVSYASTILQFNEVSFNTPFHVTTNGVTSTISAVNVPINVVFDPGFCLVAGCGGVTNGVFNLNLSATSTSAATVNAGVVRESFGGVISVTNGAINLLTVNFSDVFTGPLGASSNIAMGSAQPPDIFTGSSTVFDPAKLGIPRGFALSFSNYNPGLSLTGTTISAASADATGTFNATPPATVPEPTSIVLLGSALLFVANRLRVRK